MEIDNDYDFEFAYITSLVIELYYALDSDFITNHPLYKQNIKNQIQKLYHILQTQVVDLYFGVKRTKGKYGEATEDNQINLFENIEMLERYHKAALKINDEDRDIILKIIKKYEPQIQNNKGVSQ